MKLFIKLKSWQLFLLFSVLLAWKINGFAINAIVNYLGIALVFAWICAIGIYGNKIINAQYFNRSNKLFIVFCKIFLIIFPIASFLDNVHLNPILNFIFIILNVMLAFPFFYILWYSGETAATLVKGRYPKIEECLFYACILIFYPIGVWIIQPKLNKLAFIISTERTVPLKEQK